MLKTIQTANTTLFQSIFRSCCDPTLPKIARFLSFTGDGWFYLLLFPLVLILKPVYAFETLLLAALGFTIERLIYYILKLGFKRRRPPTFLANVESLIIASDELSLPSGHTSAAFFFVTFLCVALGPLFLPLYLWAAMVGLSRILLAYIFQLISSPEQQLDPSLRWLLPENSTMSQPISSLPEIFVQPVSIA